MVEKELKEIIEPLLPEMITLRHTIHEFPELGNHEKKTAQLIYKTLSKYGYDVTDNIKTTGLTTLLDSGKPGKTIALRAEMDALPIQEESHLPFISKVNGVMHACGHDGHLATMLLVAAVLKQYKDQFKGKIKFIFQPAEEEGSGAKLMIEAGVLENPTIDAIFGYHNSPHLTEGNLLVRDGCMMAGENSFSITVKGKGGHAAHVGTFIDPIYIGSEIVQALQGIVSRFTDPADSVVISITQFHAGTANNVVPDEAVMKGSIRTLSPILHKTIKSKIMTIAKGIAASFGGSAVIKFEQNFPPIINHPYETDLVLKTAEKIIGKEKTIRLTTPTMASEDFALYLEKVPGCFFFIGNGTAGTLHNNKYEFNDNIIPIAAEILAAVAMNYLNEN